MRWQVDPANRRVIPGPRGEQDALRFFLGSKKYIKVGHNIGYDRRITEESGFQWNGEIHDTMIMAHVATAGDELSYALKPLCKKYLKFPDDDEKKLEDAVKTARTEARQKGYLIAGGKKDVEKGQHVVFAGSKPVKADYWLVPYPEAVTETPNDLVRDYGVGDAARAMLMFLFFWPILESDKRLMATYRREMAGWHVLRRMERRGTRIYPSQTDHLIQWYKEDMERQRIIADAHGGYILNKKGVKVRMNYNSPPQLMQKFYTERGYPVETKERKKKNKVTGEVTTKMTPTFGKDQLAVYGAVDDETGKPKDVLAKAILEWRAGRQTISAFLNIYKKFWYPEGPIRGKDLKTFRHILRLDQETTDLGKISDRDFQWLYRHAVWVLHPNYNQTGAVTGRMTCSDPNLQQVASATTGLRKSEISQRPRECFGPRPGYVWYLPDYSQIEVWLFAFMSGEPGMMKLLLSGHDFHQGVADKSFVSRPDYEARKKYYRKLAKLIMFGKLYGGGVGSEENPGRMTRLLQMPFQEAKIFIDSFEAEFSAVKEYMKRLQRDAKRDGEAWNLFGRKYELEADWAYKVVNYMIQGTAADVLKMATMRIDWMLETRYADWTRRGLGLINSIHDELMIEVPVAIDTLRLQRDICWVMQMDSALCGVPVPLPVGMKKTKRLYSVRERAYVQRWSDTDEVQIRPDSDIAYWKSKGILEVKPDILGGVPRRRYEEREFADLAADMVRCPYNQLIVTAAA
jgi:DNA polymerase I-like protein with 3'-5' exonuclease and polymerase domains